MYVHKYIVCIQAHIIFYQDFLIVHTINTSVVDPTQAELWHLFKEKRSKSMIAEGFIFCFLENGDYARAAITSLWSNYSHKNFLFCVLAQTIAIWFCISFLVHLGYYNAKFMGNLRITKDIPIRSTLHSLP